ncbi:MAG: UvrD-helicase domain-containing protein [Buchnera aphidicola (Nurudea yanoniella)]
MDLNINQNKAVNYVSGPCLVLAGAGSGKTQVIIKKIVYLINECYFNPNNIFAITFTNKAANEMKNRISCYLSQKIAKKITVSTFHSLGLEIIKSELSHFSIKSNFSIFDEQDQMTVLKNIIKKNDQAFLKKIHKVISNWKNTLIDFHSAKINSKSTVEKLYAHYYELYQSYLKSHDVLDFDDLVFLPALLLKKNNFLRLKWGKRIKYLLVDEYQDTNTVQYELIKLLSRYNSNFTLVGDDDQSIYSWRGARVQNFTLLKVDYPKLYVIKLEHNYRSSRRILKVANFLIKNNFHIFKKKLFSQLEYGSFINVISLKNEEEEAKFVSQKILFHKFLHNTKYRDYAVLYRNNSQVKILEKIFVNFKIPHYIGSNSSFFSRPEIKHLLSYLKLILNLNNDMAFLKIVNLPPRGIGSITLNKLKNWSKKRKQSLFCSSCDINLKNVLTLRNFNALNNFTMLIIRLKESIYSEPKKMLSNFIFDIKYDQWLLKTVKNEKIYQKIIKNIYTLLNWISELICKYDNKVNMLFDIITQFILKNELHDKNISEDKVQLMTLHASKGLEFSYVFIIGMEEGILPHYNAIHHNVDEERRLVYVGITRAKKELFLSYSRIRFQYGTMIYTKPSRFLSELPKHDLLWYTKNI